jgi:hypothetical protein
MTVDDITDTLAALGDTPDEIAASLRRLGIRGQRAVMCDCPLSRYATEALGEPVMIGFGTASVFVELDDGTELVTELTEAQRQFVWRFDHRGYRDLESDQ